MFTFIGLIVANDLELGLIAFLGAAHSIILLVLENVLSNAERTLSYRSPAESFQEISQVVLSPVVKAAIFASRLTIALTLVGITCAPFLIYGFGPDITEFISAITFNNLVLVVAFSVVVADPSCLLVASKSSFACHTTWACNFSASAACC